MAQHPTGDSDQRATRRRVLMLYVAAIVGPTLVLLYLGIQAVQRQRQAIEQLSAANRQLQERTLAAALGGRIVEEAEACLRDAAAVAMRHASDVDWNDPRASRKVRAAFEAMLPRHPIARATFLIEGGVIRVPRTEIALPASVPDLLSRTADDPLAEMFGEAENFERAKRPRDALRIYQGVHDRAVLPDTRALAVARMARCHEALGDHRRAAALHRHVMEQYPDAYDTSGRPHALVAAVEWRRLTSDTERDVEPALANIQSALRRGKWELDPDAAEYFASELSVPSATDASATYLQLTALGRALQGRFRPQSDTPPGVLERTTVKTGVHDEELYYLPHLTSTGRAQIVGLAVRLSHVRDVVLPAAAAELKITADSAILRQATGHGAALLTALPSLEIALDDAVNSGAGHASADLLVFGGAVALVLGVLLLGVVLLLRDVAREAAVSELRADLIGGVSHELKTPLTAIRMYGETLSASPDAPVDVRRSFYEVIVQESDRLTRLVDRVLDFSQVTARERPYTLVSMELLPLVQAVVTQYEPYLRQQGFAFEFLADPECADVRIDADREAVTRALVNLLDNAIKYSDDERWIRVAVGPAGPGVVQVQVEDRGVGLHRGDHERIFRKFYRGANRAGRGGYGLGLYLVKHMMTAHGGRIDIWSEPGRGSRFNLVFPITRADAPRARDVE